MDYQELIRIDPTKRAGRPCIRGLRITVYDILEYLAGVAIPFRQAIIRSLTDRSMSATRTARALAAGSRAAVFNPRELSSHRDA